MAIEQAQVPVQHLATAVGVPNRLEVEYSTDVLLPVPGPLLIARLRRDLLRAVLLLNDFFLLAKDVQVFQNEGGKFDLRYRLRTSPTPPAGLYEAAVRRYTSVAR